MNRDVQIKGPRSNHIVSDRSATPTIKINKIALISTQEHHATSKTIYTRELKFINGYKLIFALVFIFGFLHANDFMCMRIH